VINPIWGGIADHYGRKLMVLRAMLGIGAMMMLVPFAPTPLWFAAALMLIAVFNGFTPAGVSLLLANTPPTRIGRVLSLAQTGSLLGQALGPAVGAALAALLASQLGLYWISGGLTLAGGLLVLLFVREVKQLAPGPWRVRPLGGLRELLAVPQVSLLFLLIFAFSIMWQGSVTTVSVFVLQLIGTRGEDASAEAFWVGTVAVALSVSMLVALPAWGRVIDRFGPGKVLVFCGAAAVVTHLPLFLVETPMQLMLTRIAFGLTVAGMQTAIFQLLRQHAPVGMDARAVAYASAFQFLAMGVAPFAAGLIGPSLGLRTYFLLTSGLMLAGVVFWLRTAKSRM